MNENMNVNFSNVEIQPTIDKLSNFVKTSIEKLDKLSVQNQELISRNSTLERSLGDKDSSFYEMVNQKSEFELKVHNITLQNQELEKIIQENKDKIEQLDNKQEEINVLQNMYNDLEQKFNLVSEKANFLPILDEELTKEREKLNSLNQKVNSLESELERLIPVEVEKLNLENSLNQLQGEFDELLGKKIELDSTIERLLPIENGYGQLKHELNESHQKYAELHNEKTKLEIEISRLTPLEKNLSIISKELSHKNLVLNERALNVEKLKSVIAEHENSIYKLKNKESNLTIILEQKDVIISELNQQLYEANQRVEISEKEMWSLKESLESTINSFNDANDKLNTYDSDLKDAERQILELQISTKQNDAISTEDNSLMVKDIEIRALTSKIDELEYKLFKISENDLVQSEKFESSNDMSNALVKELEDLQAKYETLENEHLITLNEHSELRNNLEEIDSLYEEVKQSFNLTRIDFQELSNEFSDLKNYQVEASEVLESFRKQSELEIQTLKSLIAEKELSLKELSNSLEQHIIEKAKLEEIISNLKSDLDKSADQVEAYRKNLDDLNDEFSISESAKSDNLRKIDELKQIITNLSEQIISKDKEIINLNSTDNQLFPDVNIQSDSQIKFIELEDTIKKKSSIIDNLTIKITDLNSQVMISNINLNQSREKIEGLEEVLKTRYEQISILETQLNEFENKLNDKFVPNNELVNELDRFIKMIDLKISTVS